MGNFEYVVEDKTKKLDYEIEHEVVSSIPNNYDRWNSLRQSQLEDIELIRKLIYVKPSEKIEFGENVVLPDIYELEETLTAHIWENVYKAPANMFSVEGRDEASQANSGKQKALIVNALENMKIKYELEKIVKNGVETGDMIAFVGWETKMKQIRRKKTDMEISVEKLKCAITNTQPNKFLIENKITFEGASIKAITSENFVFDPSKSDRWDSCPKIVRSYASYEEILLEKNYIISKETSELLKNLTEKKEGNDDVKDGAVCGDQVEILEYWGDIRLRNGDILRNWLIVVAGRSKVIRFEANPFIINPIIYTNMIEDPQTKRGISPLRVAVNLNLISSDIMNKNLDVLALLINPPYLVPEGAMSGKVKLTPGHIQEYNPAIMSKEPIKMDFSSALCSWDFIQYFKKNIESSTGIFAYMSGNPVPGQRTATETDALVSGQSARLSKIIDSINQKLIVPIIEKVADLICNYEFGKKEICLPSESSGCQQLIIDDAVRQGDYKYTYSDNKAGFAKKAKFREFIEFMGQFVKIAPGIINVQEAFKYGLEQLGVENTGRFVAKTGDSMDLQ
jgi:hypothetical protein